MNKKIFQTILLAVAFTTFVQAQTKGKQNSKTETDTAKTENQKADKFTLTIEGDSIFFNGLPLEVYKDYDFRILKGKDGRKLSSRGFFKDSKDAYSFLEEHNLGISEKPNRASLGIISEKIEEGAKVITVNKGSAAEKAGLQKGDIITKIDDIKISDSNTIILVIRKYKPEDKISITYIRDNKTLTTQAVLDKNKAPRVVTTWNNIYDNGFESENGNFFFNAYPRTPKIGLDIQDVEEGNGVKVLAVTEESPASKSSLRKDDIITEINDTDFKDVDNFKMKLRGIKEGDTLKLKYKRGNKFYNTEIKLPKKLKKASL